MEDIQLLSNAELLDKIKRAENAFNESKSKMMEEHGKMLAASVEYNEIKEILNKRGVK